MLIRNILSCFFRPAMRQHYSQSNKIQMILCRDGSKTFQSNAALKRTMLSSAVVIGMHLPFVKCLDDKKKPFELPEASEMSPKQILQQSTSVSTAATLQLLTLTTAAVINACTAYRHAIAAEMLLLNRSLEFVNVAFMQEDFNDTLINLRADVQKAHAELQELLGFMEYVEKLAGAAAETSFLSGAEYSSFSLSDVLFTAQSQISEQKIKNQNMESELRALHQQHILRSKKSEKSQQQEEPEEESENS